MLTKNPKVYLAGPDVFFPNPIELGRRKKVICERHGLNGLYPLDNEVTASDRVQVAMEIFHQNCRLMDEADAIIANMTPFRGVSMDPGTAFEIGYTRAQGKPVFDYSDEKEPTDYAGRMRRLNLLGDDGGLIDCDGLAVEDFGLPDNLMMVCAALDSGTTLITAHDLEGLPTELAIFEECVKRAAVALRANR